MDTSLMHTSRMTVNCAEVFPGFAALQALEYLERSCSVLPDLVLLDVMMPSISGYEVAARLRQSYPSSLLPIIMVSAGCSFFIELMNAFRCSTVCLVVLCCICLVPRKRPILLYYESILGCFDFSSYMIS
jgi:response regulator of citrate/malate metabolism